jgi:hypothetical protein
VTRSCSHPRLLGCSCGRVSGGARLSLSLVRSPLQFPVPDLSAEHQSRTGARRFFFSVTSFFGLRILRLWSCCGRRRSRLQLGFVHVARHSVFLSVASGLPLKDFGVCSCSFVFLDLSSLWSCPTRSVFDFTWLFASVAARFLFARVDARDMFRVGFGSSVHLCVRFLRALAPLKCSFLCDSSVPQRVIVRY